MTSPSASSRDHQSTNHSHQHQQSQPPWIPSPSRRPFSPHHPSPSHHPAPSHTASFYQGCGSLPGGTESSCRSSQKGRGVADGNNTLRPSGKLPVHAETRDKTLLQDRDCVGRVEYRESVDTESMLGECIVDPISDPRRRMRRRELSQFAPEEADRILRRRERNKVAATKCRHKRHAQHEHLVKELQGMECENTSLTYEIRQLQRQRQALSDVLRHHQMSCSSHHQLNLADVPADIKMPPGGLSGPYPLPYTR